MSDFINETQTMMMLNVIEILSRILACRMIEIAAFESTVLIW